MTTPAKPAAQVVEYATERLVETDSTGYGGDQSWVGSTCQRYAELGYRLHSMNTYAGSDRRNKITLLVFERPVIPPVRLLARDLRPGTVFRWVDDQPEYAYLLDTDGSIKFLHGPGVGESFGPMRESRAQTEVVVVWSERPYV